MNRLIEYLPPHEKGSKVFIEILMAIYPELNQIWEVVEETGKQLDVDTATWALSLYEKELDLPVDPDLSLSTRRSLIKAKLLMQPPGSRVSLTNVIRGFAKSATIIEYFNEYRFKLSLSANDGLGDNLSRIDEIIDSSKPAHLDYFIELSFKQDTPEYGVGAGTVYGEGVLIYPLIKTELLDSATVHGANLINTSDDTSVWPKL